MQQGSSALRLPTVYGHMRREVLENVLRQILGDVQRDRWGL